MSVRQGPARLAHRLPAAMGKPATSAVSKALLFHQAARSAAPTTTKSTILSTSRILSRSQKQFAPSAARSYYQQAQQTTTAGPNGTRRLLVGGAIFGGTLVAINLVFNRETRDDGGMPPFERDYLNNTFLHTGLGIGIIGLTARQMVNTGFVYRLMVTNPWVVGIGGLALSFGTMIGTRSISPDK